MKQRKGKKAEKRNENLMYLVIVLSIITGIFFGLNLVGKQLAQDSQSDFPFVLYYSILLLFSGLCGFFVPWKKWLAPFGLYIGQIIGWRIALFVYNPIPPQMFNFLIGLFILNFIPAYIAAFIGTIIKERFFRRR